MDIDKENIEELKKQYLPDNSRLEELMGEKPGGIFKSV